MQIDEHSVQKLNQLKTTKIPIKEMQINPSVLQVLQNIVLKEGFRSHKILTRTVSTNGDNYMGKLYEIDIKGKTDYGPKEINIFVKYLTSNEPVEDIVEDIRSVCNIKNCFLNEAYIYTELSNIFHILQDCADILEKERFQIVKSYDCRSDVIILENISRKGFKTLDRFDVMPIKYAELAVIQLAKFHGLSFVMKYKNREYFNKKIESVKKTLNFHETWKDFVKRQFNISSLFFDSDTRRKLENFRHTFYEKYPKYYTGETNSAKCICHGDFRITNILVKDEDDPEVFLIDYQFILYGSPIVDLFYFIFTATDRNFRKANMSFLKNLYHSSLTEFLKYFDLDVNNIYPKIVFEKDFDESLDLGLMIALYALPIFLLEEDVSDFVKDGVNTNSKVNDVYKRRITEIVEDYLDWGILK